MLIDNTLLSGFNKMEENLMAEDEEKVEEKEESKDESEE